MPDQPTIEAYYLEERTFPPPDAYKKAAHINDALIYDEAEEDGSCLVFLRDGDPPED